MATKRTSARLHPDLRGRRVAVVLSGGGALGAYEVGVLRVLERMGLEPAILAGTSVGALNVVSWVLLGGRTKPLMRLWRGLSASGIGLRWSTLALRILGAFLMVLALAELLLTIVGEQNLSSWVRGRLKPPGAVLPGDLDIWAWVALAGVGLLLARGSRWVEPLLARWPGVRPPGRVGRALGWGAAVLAVAWVAVVVLGWPWPLRAHASVAILVGVAWLAVAMQGKLGSLANELARRVLPDTQGAGLWSSASRRRVVERLARQGDPERLCGGMQRVILSACGLETGRLTYFVNWDVDPEEFLRRMGARQDDVVVLDAPEEVMQAAVASSALPLVFEPVAFRGDRYVDGALFTNQPLRAALAAGAEAAVVVLLSPVRPVAHEPLTNLFSVGARLLEVGHAREAEAELLNLPPEWRAPGRPRPLCLVQPARSLEGGVLGFDPARHRRLMERGRQDAWRALEEAGWLEEGSAGESSLP